MSIIFLEVVITTLLRSLNGRSSDYISLKKPSSMRSTTPEASSFQVPSSPNSQQANIKGQHTSFSVIIISCNTVINEKKHYYNILLPQVGAPVICQTPDNHTVIFPFLYQVYFLEIYLASHDVILLDDCTCVCMAVIIFVN